MRVSSSRTLKHGDADIVQRKHGIGFHIHNTFVYPNKRFCRKKTWNNALSRGTRRAERDLGARGVHSVG
jgi:hypothetical protein